MRGPAQARLTDTDARLQQGCSFKVHCTLVQAPSCIQSGCHTYLRSDLESPPVYRPYNMVASAVVEPTLGVASAVAGPLDPLGGATGPGHPQAPSDRRGWPAEPQGLPGASASGTFLKTFF